MTKQHDRENFDCGEESLNDFLKKFARQNDERGLGKTFVLVETGNREILGYYTLSSSSVTFEKIPENLPRYPIPVAHLGRLAVDKKAKGQGLGEILLVDALKRVSKIAEQLGIYAVEVVALSESAKNFYLKYGFKELQDNRFHLYLPLKTIKKLNFD
ncbi:MAG: GNAT family N-acetyltransferase [Acidobacteriota bacterium]|nr:GNAT family N-acetyltransferase [Acidobacteriota bacterium]